MHFPLPIVLANAFFDAYVQSDWIGKIIFIALLLLSVASWSIIIHKAWITHTVRKQSESFQKVFSQQRNRPLSIHYESTSHPECPNAFYLLYEVLKTKSLEVLEKNRRYAEERDFSSSSKNYLSATDIEFLTTQVLTGISAVSRHLDKNLYLLSTIVTLAPFLGLLGTVYGILTTFSEMQSVTGGSNDAILGGLSLALATTVVGLIDAIPALLGYNYLKHRVHEFSGDMEQFANEMLASIELHYRTVDKF